MNSIAFVSTLESLKEARDLILRAQNTLQIAGVPD